MVEDSSFLTLTFALCLSCGFICMIYKIIIFKHRHPESQLIYIEKTTFSHLNLWKKTKPSSLKSRMENLFLSYVSSAHTVSKVYPKMQYATDKLSRRRGQARAAGVQINAPTRTRLRIVRTRTLRRGRCRMWIRMTRGGIGG